MVIPHSSPNLLSLLQLVSPALPVGAYSYSEGIETLVEQGVIGDRASLSHWLSQELAIGSIRLDAAVVLRTHRSALGGALTDISRWNQWLSAMRETEELRLQHWQMGRSLLQLGVKLEETAVIEDNSPEVSPSLAAIAPLLEPHCNFAIAFGLVAAHWHIDASSAVLGYLQAWVANGVSAALRTIPLGQTEAQQVLRHLQPDLCRSHQEILTLVDEDLVSCSWGLALASMAHEVQYSRLFRS